MTRLSGRQTQWAAAALILTCVAACVDSDKIPPKGSIITVAANPATIPLASGAECISLLNVQNCGTSQVVATVTSELGVPLTDQDVRFSSTAGKLFTGNVTTPVDAANIPIRTDDLGNAMVNLVTSTTTTVTARSGLNSGTLSISTVAGNLSTILLTNDTTSTGCTTSSLNVTSCNQTICFKAEALDSDGDGVPGVVILFKLQNNVAGSNTFSGQFTPSQAVTNTNGEAFAKFDPDTTCPAQCGAGKTCQAEVVATTQGGSFQSSAVQLTINIQ